MPADLRSRRPPALARAVGAVALAAIAVTPLAAAAQSGEPAMVAPATRNVTPPGILPGPQVDGPLVREVVPPAPPDPPRWHRHFLPRTADAATFVAGDATIRLSGVRPPAVDRRCEPADREPWPCGRTALHALRMFLRGRAVECYYPKAAGITDITAPCRVGGTDIALWLLGLGWVETDDLATEAYRDAELRARCAGAGLWRGLPPPETCPKPAAGS